MSKKRKIVYLGAVIAIVVGIIIMIILNRQEINFNLFTSRTGIKDIEDIEYIMFYMNNDKRENITRYYITDKDLIHKIYDIFDETVYTKTKTDYFGDYDTNLLYKITFCQTLEKNRNLTIFGYDVETEDTLLAWPTVESNYGTGQDDFWDYGIDHYVVKVNTDLYRQLQKICENDLRYITMGEIEEIIEGKERPDIFDFYGYLHEQVGEYCPNEEPAENLYRINRLKIGDYEGYLEVRNQYETVHSENIEGCHWYHDILSVTLYNNDGELQKVLYER